MHFIFPEQIERVNLTEFDRIYFGSETCQNLIPSCEELKNVLKIAKNIGIEVTLVTPFCTDIGLRRISKLFGIMDRDTEVVFNDWGVFTEIKNNEMNPVLGRLLIKQKKDPRINNECDDSIINYFKLSNLQGKEIQRFLKLQGIGRVELDNSFQGYELVLDSNIRASLNYPLVYITSSRFCQISSFYKGYPNIFDEYNCNRECKDTCFLSLIEDLKIPLLIIGNACYYVNNKLNIKAHIDRIVFNKYIMNYYYGNDRKNPVKI